MEALQSRKKRKVHTRPCMQEINHVYIPVAQAYVHMYVCHICESSNPVKLSFRELCGSKLSSLHPSDNRAIIHWVENRLKTERKAVSSCDTNF